MKITILLISIFLFTAQVNASLITYNFSGKLTLISDPDNLLSSNRGFHVGDTFQSIYTIETDTPMHSGGIGPGDFRDSTYISAIRNYQFYVNNIKLVDSYYRLQTLRVLSGMARLHPTDWIEITTDGGIDNYSNTYGANVYGEYIDSSLWFYDYSGTALDDYNTNYFDNIPITLDFADFSSGNIIIKGESFTNPAARNYQLRGNINSFSSKGYMPVPEPSSIILLFAGIFCSIGYGFKMRRKESN